MKNARKIGFSLIEIILSVVVLSVISVVSLKIFLLSDQLNERAYELDQSVFLAESKLQELRNQAFEEHIYYYAKDWALVSNANEAAYGLKVFTVKENVGTLYKVIVFHVDSEKEQVIYELESKTFK